jgi:hypothetical protein
MHPALVDRLLHRLTHHIPQRSWQAALGAVQGEGPRGLDALND